MLATLRNVMKFGVQQRLFPIQSSRAQQTRLPLQYFRVFIFSRRSLLDAADVETEGISCKPPPPAEQGQDDHSKSTSDLLTVSVRGRKTFTAAREGTGFNCDGGSVALRRHADETISRGSCSCPLSPVCCRY